MLQLEVKRVLYKLTIEQLIKVCNALQMSGPEEEHVTGKTRSQVISHVVKYLEREELAGLEDEGMSDLLSIHDVIGNIDTATNINESEISSQTEPQEKLQKEAEALRLSLREKENAMYDLMKTNTHPPVSFIKPEMHTTLAPPNGSMWHKDFKIAGLISEPGQKDKLTFSSLAKQIESGCSKGYPESEIIDAVIRAITPGLQLRSYLEGKDKLTLPALRRILRCHYQERGATELYKQLISEVQNSKETPQNFLIRTMDLRQNILFACLKYDPVLVQSLFMHTVLTGPQSDNIKGDLQPYLLQTDTSDELLLEKLNISFANEKERQDKKKPHVCHITCVSHVNTVQSSEAPVEKKSTTSQSPATLPPELLAEIKEMRSDIVQLKDLKAEICQNRETIQRPTPIPPQYHPPTREPTTVPTPYPLCSPPQSSPYNTESNEMPFYHQQSPTAVQEYRSAFGPGQMRETVQFQQRFAPQRFYPARRPQPRCLSCTQAGEEYCQHCFRCGSTEHFRAGCKAQRPIDPARRSLLN